MKNTDWIVRSMVAIISAAASIGAASIIRKAVVITPQTNIGSRDQVIPGARIVMMVAIRLNPSRHIERRRG